MRDLVQEYIDLCAILREPHTEAVHERAQERGDVLWKAMTREEHVTVNAIVRAQARESGGEGC